MKAALLVFAHFFVVMAYKSPIDAGLYVSTLVLLVLAVNVLRDLYMAGHYESQLNILNKYHEMIVSAATQEDRHRAITSYLRLKRSS